MEITRIYKFWNQRKTEFHIELSSDNAVQEWIFTITELLSILKRDHLYFCTMYSPKLIEKWFPEKSAIQMWRFEYYMVFKVDHDILNFMSTENVSNLVYSVFYGFDVPIPVDHDVKNLRSFLNEAVFKMETGEFEEGIYASIDLSKYNTSKISEFISAPEKSNWIIRLIKSYISKTLK